MSNDISICTKSIAKTNTLLEKVADSLLNRFLYITVSVTMFLSVKSLWTSKEMGLIVYLTTDKSIIGNRPARLFGLLSLADFSIHQTRSIIFVICLLNTLCISLGMYLFLKDIKNDRNKIIAICITSFLITITLDYYRYMLWDYTSLALYVSLTFAVWTFYFLFKSNTKFFAPIFAAVTELLDCRTVIFMLPAFFLVIFVNSIHKGDKKLKLWNIITLTAAALVLSLTFVNVDFHNEADHDAIDRIFKERFIENGMDEKNINEASYAFKFNTYLKLTPQELFADTLTNITFIKDAPFEDHFQLIILLFLISMILYNHRTPEPST